MRIKWGLPKEEEEEEKEKEEKKEEEDDDEKPRTQIYTCFSWK